MALRFRPHHFLCTIGFEGKGYSPEFVKNYQRIADSLRDSPGGDDVPIEIVQHTDSICDPCPNRRGKSCETEAKIQKLDQAHASILGIRAGESITWREAKTRIAEKVTLEGFNKICEPCSWRSLGVCESALKRLKLALPLLALFTLALPLDSAWAKKPRRHGRTIATAAEPSPTPTPTAPDASPSPSASPQVNKPLEWPTTSKTSLSLWKKLLPKKPSKVARQLAKAQRAFEAKKYGEARKLAHPFRTHKKFGDQAAFLEARAALLEAKKSVADNPAAAEKLADIAIGILSKIRAENLISPAYNRCPEWLGQAELVSGRAALQQKRQAIGMATLERGFQRLLLDNSIYLTPVEALDAYAKACLNKPNDLCEAWVLRLANQFAKNTLESRTLAQSFKSLVDQSKPNFANSKITLGYKQKDSDEIAFDAAFAIVLQKKWKDARKAFQCFNDDFPRSTHRYRAKYWLARVTEEDDGYEKARPIYETVAKETPLTFYGLLAQWRIGMDPLSRFSATPPPLTEEDPFQTPQEVLRIERVPELIGAEATDLAALDLREIKPRDTASGSYLLYLAGLDSLSGAYLASFGALTELIQRSDEITYSNDVLDLVFPVVSENLVQKGAAAADVDPLLVMSLIKQESGFEKDIHSSVGASGYMQLMPFTASDVEPDVKREDLLDAEVNIRVGAKYLRRMLNKYGNNVALALAAYNSGPVAVDRWIKEGRTDQGFIEFVEQIPYKETREYVGTIFRNYVYYQRKVAGKIISNDTTVFWPAGWAPRSKQ